MAEASECSLAPGSATAKPRLLVRSRASPKHHPASSPGRAHLGRWRYRTASRAPPAQRWLDPPRRPRGALPPPPLGTPLAACPLKRRGAVARDALLRAARATSPQNSGRHRLVAGNSVGMPALAGLRESGAARRLQGISADKPSKEALHRRPIGRTQAKAPQRCKAPQKLLRERRTRVGRSQRACRTPSAPPIAARGRTCPKGPENGLGAGSCVAASARSAIAAPNAPQERRQACTRTPRRRRRSGWTGP